MPLPPPERSLNAMRNAFPDAAPAAPSERFVCVQQDPRTLWSDSMAEEPERVIDVTASHIPQMLAWQGPGVMQTQLLRFRPA